LAGARLHSDSDIRRTGQARRLTESVSQRNLKVPVVIAEISTTSQFGAWSLVPPLLAVILAFATREAIFSLIVACVAGVFIGAEGFQAGVAGVPVLLQRTLGDANFIWILQVELFIGVLVAFLLRSGATQRFAQNMSRRLASRKQVQVFAWFLGMLIFFSDYFSPLLTGPVMRKLTDRARISREKLAYICDSTSAPMCVLVPLSAWSVFIAGLLVGEGTAIPDRSMAIQVFLISIPYDFYAIGAVAMVALFAGGILPEFGPMRRAEQRAINEGKLLADGAVPMMAVELSDIEPAEQIKNTNLLLSFALPLSIVVAIALGSFVYSSLWGDAITVMILEAFMAAAIVAGVTLWLQRVPMRDVVATAMQGVKGVMPAVVLLALAFSIKIICDDLGTARYVIYSTQGWITPTLLPLLAFGVCAFVSFSTGTSWGTYAITIPIFVPMALEFGGGQITTTLYATLAAVTGGGVFGDHCSPLSDTTILSSFGAACDHIDHVRTQLPYAATVAAVALALYLVVGMM